MIKYFKAQIEIIKLFSRKSFGLPEGVYYFHFIIIITIMFIETIFQYLQTIFCINTFVVVNVL